MSVINPSLKNRIEKEVLDQIMLCLENGSLKVEEAQIIARETLSMIDKVENHERNVVDFYKALADKHDQFDILYTKARGEVLRAHEENELKKAIAAVSVGDVVTAQGIAKGAIDKTANETNNNI